MGDNLLKDLFNTLKKEISDMGLISRWGGDEFLILINNQSAETVKESGENIRLTFKKQSNNKVCAASLSIGIAEFKNKTSLENAIELVDQSMYKSKSLGKDQVSF